MKNKLELTPVKTDFHCPLCKEHLFRQWGEQLHPGDKEFGVTLFCRNGDPSGNKHAQEVSGHANGRANSSDDVMIAKAYAVILAKFSGASLPSESSDDTEIQETKEETATTVEAKPVKSAKSKKERKIKGLPVVEPENTEETDLI